MSIFLRHLFTILFLSQAISLSAEDGSVDFFEQSDAFFKQYVSYGLIDYKSINEEQKSLAVLVQHIASFDLSGRSNTEVQAFWINAYNLLVIKSVVDQYPLNSPLDVAGFFDKNTHQAAGSQLTLNDIEKKKLLANHFDARFHFVLVCGAIGCPPIISRAYRPETLENQLAQQTKIALNNTDFIKVDEVGKQVELSEIFKWYKSDFERNGTKVLEFINKYRSTKIPLSFKQTYYSYNWQLNEKKK